MLFDCARERPSTATAELPFMIPVTIWHLFQLIITYLGKDARKWVLKQTRSAGMHGRQHHSLLNDDKRKNTNVSGIRRDFFTWLGSFNLGSIAIN
jgi:hypothetical protein